MLISSIILAIAMGGILTVFRASQNLHHTTQQGLEVQQNVRAALNYISRELINAGSGITYSSKLSGLPLIPVPAGALLGPLAAPVSSGSVNFITPGNGTGDSVAADGEGAPLGTPIATDILTFLGGQGDFRFVNPNPPGPTSGWGAQVFLEDNSIFSDGQVVLITNGFLFALGQVTQVLPNGALQFSNGQDELNLNSPGNGQTPNPIYFAAQSLPGHPPALAFPLSAVSYYIDAATDPKHPTLKRLANKAGGEAAGVIVANDIEDFQVRYLVDQDSNATTPNTALDVPAASELALIRGVEVTLTGRSRIRMGDLKHPDQHTRLTMTQTVFFRNNFRR